MIYGFDTDNRSQATAALLVYATWRSRDRGRLKITPDIWSQVERFTKASAKRARTIPQFLEALKPRLMCGTLHPRAMAVGIKGAIPLVRTQTGEIIQMAARTEQREFLTAALAGIDEKAVLDTLYQETSWIILLVRDRLERERPIEDRFETALDTDDASTEFFEAGDGT